MRTRLTDLAVAKIRPPTSGKYSWHPDALLPSFGVRVYVTGRRVWGITRRWSGAKHPTFRKIGEHPDMSLGEARGVARAILADPDAEPAREADAADVDTTFRPLAEQFLAHGRTKRGRALRPATVKEYRRALMVYAERLHRRPVAEIRRSEIAATIRATADRGDVTAMRTRAALSRFWSWLIANGHVEANPVTGTEGYTTPKRARVLTDGELAALWAATEPPGDFNSIVRLCLWTGCRRSEAGAMRWSEIEGDVWTIPGERAKNHRPLALPLPRQTLAALDRHPRFVGRDLVFGRGPNGFQAWSKAKERLDARLGFATAWDLHDLRRSVQTRMSEIGIARDLVNRILNHAMAPIDETYDRHGYLREKRAALEAWAHELERITGRGEAKVVPLRG